MSESTILAVAGIVGTLLGALLGAAVAGVFALRQARVQRRHDLQDTARGLVVEALILARHWRDLVSSPSARLVEAEGAGNFRAALKAVSDLQSSGDFSSLVQDLHRVIVEARLLVTGPLSDALANLHRTVHEWPEDVVEAARRSFNHAGAATARAKIWATYSERLALAVQIVGDTARASIAAEL